MAEKSCNISYEPLIRAVVERALGVPITQLRPIPTYLDTIVYAISTERGGWIFKSIDPAGQDPNGIALEAWVCERLVAEGFPAPRVLTVDTSRASFPSAYFIMERARGQPLASLQLSSAEKQPYLQQLGQVLQQLHAIQLPGFGWLDEQRYGQDGSIAGSAPSWQAAVLSAIPASTSYLQQAGISPGESDAIAQVVAAMQPTIAAYHDGRLLHGDLGPLHVWVDPATHTLTSIVDFGERMAGDPLWDFVDYDWQDLPALWAAYAPDVGATPIFSPAFYGYALLRTIPWAAKWHARGATHVLDWLRLVLTRASDSATTGAR